jgi:RNA polymerase sigma factor (sigma-70 family)
VRPVTLRPARRRAQWAPARVDVAQKERAAAPAVRPRRHAIGTDIPNRNAPPPTDPPWEEALGALWPGLWKRTVRRVGDAALAEDLVQEAMARAWPAIAEGRMAAAAVPAYLRTTLDRLVVDHYRRRARRPQWVELDEAHDAPAPDSPLEALLGRLEAGEVRRAFGALPERDRLVLRLRLLDGLTAQEVGRRLGQSPVAIRVQQHRALKRLAALLLAREGPDEGGSGA